MPQIIPIRELKNTSAISNLCHNSSEPIYVTKNGYGDMVIMSVEVYERSQRMFMDNVYKKLKEAETDIESGNVHDASKSLNNLKEKYDL